MLVLWLELLLLLLLLLLEGIIRSFSGKVMITHRTTKPVLLLL